jgi:hypothetical protein
MRENLTVIPNNQPVAVRKKRETTRKIGKCTYIVSSSFKEGKEKDIVSTIARLIQNDNTTKPGA